MSKARRSKGIFVPAYRIITEPSFCGSFTQRVYITATRREIEFGTHRPWPEGRAILQIASDYTCQTTETIQLNILSAAPTGLRAFFDCVALTGTRLGGVLALKWKHVDLERRLLRIEHSLWRGQLLSPKTAASTRDIPLGCALSETLKNHRENSLHQGPDDFVFCKKGGSALDPDVLRKDALYPILDRLGIPRKKGASGFHTFRHSAASIVNDGTGNLKQAQKFLGHSDQDDHRHLHPHLCGSGTRRYNRSRMGNLWRFVPSCSQYREQEQL